MRDLQPIVRLLATLLFGLTTLAVFSLLATQMATHYFQEAAERTIRRAFNEGIQTRGGVRYEAVCRRSDADGKGYSQCDPIALKAQRSLRSASCSGRGLLRVLGRQWRCVARFTDGTTLRVEVSLGFGRRRLELVLPFREPGA